jgi:putative inorganic carbon (HCO3(-)) transporter
VSQARLQLPARAPALEWLYELSPSLWVTAVVLALAAALLPGLWTLAGLVALAACGAILVKPQLAVYLLALSVPLGSLAEVKVGESLTVTPTEALAGLLAVGWMLISLTRRRILIPLTPLSVPLAAMVAIVALSAYQATDLAMTAKETLKWVELALVYLFVVAEMGSRRQVMVLLGVLFAGATIEAVTGFAQFALGLGPDAFAIGRFMRAYGTFEQPNPYAGYLGMLIPLAVGFLLTRPSKWTRNVVLAVCVLSLGAVAASLSRGAWAGIALALGTVTAFWSHRSRIMLASGAIAAVPVAALAFLNLRPAEITSRLATAVDYFRFIDVRQETVTPDNLAVIERMAHWQAALDMIAANPLLGVGAGNYSAAYENFMVPGWEEALGHAHNFYLNIAAETGIVGLLVYLALFAVAGAHTVRWLIRSDRDTCLTHRHLWKGILLGVLGALIASAVHNMFDSLFVHGMSVQLGMILALAQVSAAALAGQVSSARGQPVS